MVRRTPPESVPPTLSPYQAIPLLQRQVERLEQKIIKLPEDNPEVQAWESTTKNILNQAFGMPHGQMHSMTQEFEYANSGAPIMVTAFGAERDPSEDQRLYVLKQEKRKALLNAFIEQLQDLAPPSVTTAPDRYLFHSEIEVVSGHLYRGGHFKQAALEAYIRVIEQVKRVSGIPDDGDSLMNKAFGADKQVPIIQLNSLASESEKDEQRGIMYLFKGVVGLRNSKAHSNRLFNDPARAHEYLALASLLMRLLEISQINRKP